jgi:hypothetical protein
MDRDVEGPRFIEAEVKLLTERAGLVLPVEEIRRLARSYKLVCDLIARVHSPSRDSAVDLAITFDPLKARKDGHL